MRSISLLQQRTSPRLVAIANGATRLVSLVVSFISIRLVTTYLGSVGYTAYSQFTALSAWLLLLDVGLGATVQNLTSSQLDSRTDLQQTVRAALNVSAKVFVFAAVSWLLVLGPLSYSLLIRPLTGGEGALPFPWYLALGVLCTIPGAFAWLPRLVIGAHRGELMYGAQAVVTVVGLGGLLLVLSSSTSRGMAWLPLLVITVPLVGLHAALAWVALTKTREIRPSPTLVREILRPAPAFALFAVLSAAVNQVDVFVAGRVLSVHDAAVYAALQRLLQVMLTFLTTYIAALWPVITTQLSERRYDSVRSLLARTTIVKCGIVTIVGICLWFLLTPTLRILAPALSPKLPPYTGLIIGLWLLVRCVSDTYCLYFLASNRMRLVNAFVPAQALLSIVGQIYFGTRYGAPGILLGLLLSFALTSAWVLPLVATRSLRKATS